jgi:hypothetical protein
MCLRCFKNHRIRDQSFCKSCLPRMITCHKSRLAFLDAVMEIA